MAIQMYDKQGNSKIVENPQVQDHLRSGWKFKKPAVVENHRKKSKQNHIGVRDVELKYSRLRLM